MWRLTSQDSADAFTDAFTDVYENYQLQLRSESKTCLDLDELYRNDRASFLCFGGGKVISHVTVICERSFLQPVGLVLQVGFVSSLDTHLKTLLEAAYEWVCD